MLRLPMADFEEWAELRAASRAFLHAVEALVAGRRSHPRRVPPSAQAFSEDWRSDQSYAFFVFRSPTTCWSAGLTLAQHPARRRPGQSSIGC